MSRYLGLDLGTKTLGVAISDKTNILVVPYKLIRFAKEDYEAAKKEVLDIIEKEKITDIAIGLPKNMDGSLGFASQRTFDFIKLLDLDEKMIHIVDERLTTMEAKNILHDNNLKEKNFRDKIDMQSAVLILENYMRSIKNENR